MESSKPEINRPIRLNAGGDADWTGGEIGGVGGDADKPGSTQSNVEFTNEQWIILCNALKLEGTVTVGDMLKTINEMVAKVEEAEQRKDAEKVAASVQRFAAEQTIDQAIRQGRAHIAHRESLITAYQNDPAGTVRKLNNAELLPIFELGYSNAEDVYDPRDAEFDAGFEKKTPDSWVR